MNERGSGHEEGTYHFSCILTQKICPKTWIPSTYQKYINMSFVVNKYVFYGSHSLLRPHGGMFMAQCRGKR